MSANILRYGKETPLPEQIPLRAGMLTMVYEDGDLRSIKQGEYELVRRIYCAVRDRNWGTVLPVFSDVQMDIREDSFDITYRVENKEKEIFFAWKGEIAGDAQGTITFRMDGQASSTFLKNRIGFCVLHPAGVAGASCTVTQVDGSIHTAAFPLDLNPNQPPLPFTDMVSIRHPVGPVQVEIRFEGDAFEMEDQRNWTDASFKTFCTPLRHPYPVEIDSGTRITQSITLKVSAPASVVAVSPGLNQSRLPIWLTISPAQTCRLPRLGLGISSCCRSLTPQEAARLKCLGLDHLRADLDLANPVYPSVLRQAVAESQAASAPLHVALHLENDAQLQELVQVLAEIKPGVALWLIYPAKEYYQGGTPIAEMLAIARRRLSGPFAAGTNTDFIFFQRNIPPTAGLDAVSFAVTPQVHAFDNLSMMETLEAQVQALQTAHKLVGTTPVMVSPITLKPRLNLYASASAAPVPLGDLPSQVDPRQMSLFAAAWTVGSIRAMALGGAQTATYYETIGWRGVMESESGPPVPEKFHSLPGMLFPAYHVFAALAGFAAGEVLATSSSEALKAQALAVRKGDRLRVLLANLTAMEQVVIIDGLPAGTTIRILDETNLAEYGTQPVNHLSDSIILRPYAVAVLGSG